MGSYPAALSVELTPRTFLQGLILNVFITHYTKDINFE